ncbi:NAD-dependent epimerase/dehydratase family protein [Microbacterium sp. GXF6406]
MTRPVLITGATGFVGSAVSRQASSRPTFRIARRGRPEGNQPVHAVDVTDRSALQEAARGAGSIIHCVSYVGSDADHAWHVNDEGTRVLVEIAEELVIRSLVYVSTTGVYGGGTHDETSESAPAAPASEASRSRLSAERRVLGAGGSVIRPHLTYGVGDRWFIPRLVSAATLLGGVPRGVTTSTISVEDLAQQIWLLHDHAAGHGHSGVHNASHDSPATLHAILQECGARYTQYANADPIDPGHARELLLGNGLSRHQADKVTRTNTFSSTLPTILPELSNSHRFQLSATARAWYSER